jgi:hypothetical protein
MDPQSTAELAPANLRELDGGLRKVWQFGSNVIVGWRRTQYGLQVLYVPTYSLPRVAAKVPRVMQLGRELERESDVAQLLAAGAKEAPVRLLSAIDSSHANAVNNAVRVYSVTHFPCRAVALFDIVSFSLYDPAEQVVLVNVLSHYIRLAGQHCRALGMPLSVRMTTTGDGFYVWNAHYGMDGDVALFCTILLVLGYTYAARNIADGEAITVPRLRCGIHFGSHYEFYQGGGNSLESGGYVVGDVTINLARILGKARAGHLLVGAYNRMVDSADYAKFPALNGVQMIDTLGFMGMAQEGVRKLIGGPFPGGKIEQASVFFTGPRVTENAFRMRKYYVRDKHGLVHGCYNARVNIRASNGSNIAFGLRDEDLGAFEADFDEAEDIVVQLG